MPSDQDAPLVLRLQLVRSDDPAEPYAPLRGQRYHVGWEDVHDHQASFGEGGYENAILQALQDFRALELDEDRAAFLGDQLRAFLGERWNAQELRLKEARASGRPILLTIATQAQELLAIPWEMLRLKHEPGPLALWPKALVCYELLGTTSARPWKDPLPEGGRILFAWAGDSELGRELRVPHDAYVQLLQKHARAGFVGFSVRQDVLEHATLPALQERLAQAREEGRPYAILHVLCHGGVSESGGYSPAAGLLLKSTQGTGYALVGPAALHATLAPHADALQTVVLSVCHSAGASIVPSRLGSLALAVHEAGVPSVVASRTELSKRGALTLADTLYHALFVELCSLETALMKARAALARQAVESPGRPVERQEYASLQVFRRCTPQDSDLRPIVFKPYRGLSSFEPAHRRFFFGREAEASELLAKIELLEVDPTRPRVLLVAGGSGTGKSSLIRAGVLPALEARGGWQMLELRPTAILRTPAAVTDPRQTGPQPKATSPLEGQANSSAADEVLSLLNTLESRPQKSGMIYIDALEEAFTRLNDAQRRAFGIRLGTLARAPGASWVVLCTLRLDYSSELGKLLLEDSGQQRFGALIGQPQHWMVLRELGAEQQERMIHAPASRVGLELDPTVALKLKQDLRDAPEAMPLLEHALEHLWLHRTGNRLAGSADFRARGLMGLLEQTAEHCVAALRAQDEQAGGGLRLKQLRRVLLALVDFRGDIRVATRRAAAREELEGASEQEDEALHVVLFELERHRLVVSLTEESQAENGSPGHSGEILLAHEALVRCWKLLASWLHAHAALMPMRVQLRDEARLWTGAGAPRTPEYLRLRGERLRSAEEGLASGTLDLTVSERAYLQACRTYEAEDLRRELERRVTQKRLNQLIRVAGVAYVGLLLLGAVATWLYWNAKTLRQQASDLNWVRWAQERRETDPFNAALGLLQVKDFPGTLGWRQLASNLLDQPIPYQRFDTGLSLVEAVASPKGSPILLKDAEGVIRLWSAEVPSEPRTLAHSTRDSEGRTSCSRVCFSPRGDRFAIATSDGVELWSERGTQEVSLRGAQGCPEALSFSPDGKHVLVHAADKRLQVWAVQRPEAPLALPAALHDPITSAHFSTDGHWLITGHRLPDTRGEVLALSLQPPPADGPALVQRLLASSSPVLAVGVSRGRLAALLENGEVSCLELEPDTGVELQAAPPRSCWQVPTECRTDLTDAGPLPSLVLSPTGTTLAALSGAGCLAFGIEDTPGHYRDAPPLGPVTEGFVPRFRAVRFTSDGRQAVVETRADAPLLVQLDPTREELSWSPLLAHQGGVISAQPVAGDRWTLTAGTDGQLMLWPQAGAFSRWQTRALGGTRDWVLRSLDGSTFALGAASAPAHIWRKDWKAPVPLIDFPSAQAAVLHPSGSQLAVLSRSHLTLYHQGTQEEYIRQPERPVEGSSLAYSPKGERLALGLEEGSAELLESQSLAIQCSRALGHSAVTALAFSPDGTRLAAGTAEGAVRILDASGASDPEACLEVRATASAASARITALHWSPEGRWLLTMTQGGGASLWSGKQGETPQTLLESTSGILLEPSFSADGRRLALATDRPMLSRLYDVTQATPQATERRYEVPPGATAPGSLAGVRLSPHGDEQVLLGADGSLWVVENDPMGVLRLEIPGRKGTPLDFGLDADGRTAWTFSDDGMLRRWPISSAALRDTLGCITRACLEPDTARGSIPEAPERLCTERPASLELWAGPPPACF